MSTFASTTTIRTARRPTRRSPSISAHCAPELSRVPSDDWDRLIGRGNAPLRHGFLTAWEESELPGLRSRPVLVTDPSSGRLRGASPGYFYDLDLPGVRWPQSAAVMDAVRRVWPRLLLARTYEIGTPVPLANPFLVAETQAPQAVVRALIERALEEADSGGAAFMLVQNFASRTGVVADELTAHGLAAVPGPPTAVVDLRYDSFDEYLAAMRAQYRRRANKAFSRTQQLTIEHLHDFAALADELAALWRSIYERASEIRREVLTPGFFRGASDLEETSVLLARRRDGSIAAFALLLGDGPMLSFLQCGFEQSAGRGEGAYFRLLYEIVRLGIEQGYRLVDLGITTLEPKLDVGAVPVPLFAWIRHRNPVLQRIILELAHGPLQRPAALEPRRVFKDPPRPAREIAATVSSA